MAIFAVVPRMAPQGKRRTLAQGHIHGRGNKDTEVKTCASNISASTGKPCDNRQLYVAACDLWHGYASGIAHKQPLARKLVTSLAIIVLIAALNHRTLVESWPALDIYNNAPAGSKNTTSG